MNDVLARQQLSVDRLVGSDLQASIDDRRITGYHGSRQLRDCPGLPFGRLFGAQDSANGVRLCN